MTQPNRLLALDVMRGITIAGMIMVNNPGSWSNIYAPLRHAEWNGLTPTDLVFPFFMFIMGVSMFFSFRKYNFTLSADATIKIIRRTVIIFLIGIAINWFSIFCYGILDIGNTEMGLFERFFNNILPFDRFRTLGVMQRLALSYCGAAFITLLIIHRYYLQTIAGILIAYFFILLFGNGFELSIDNIIAIVDNSLWGDAHMYKETLADGTRIAFDPEGLISTLPSIAHVMIGIWVGKIISSSKENNDRISNMFVFGTIILFIGLLLSYGCPINKKIWSSTFVLTTCGFGTLFLALLIWIIDIKGYKSWTRFFESFGINPLFMYVLGAFLSILFGSIRFPYADGIASIKGFAYNHLIQPILGYEFGSLIYALLFVGINWIFGFILYKKQIYIKI